MGDIYDDAIADRKRLLDVAEKNAKNKIVDAITPRIKELVENAVLGKLNEELGDDDDILLDVDVGIDDVSGGLSQHDAQSIVPGPGSIEQSVEIPPLAVPPAAASSVQSTGIDVSAGENAGLSLPGPDGKVVLDIDAFMTSGDNPDEQFQLTPESIRALGGLVGSTVIDLNEVDQRILGLESIIRSIDSSKNPSTKERETARQVRLECQNIYDSIQSVRDVLDEMHLASVESKLESMYGHIMERYTNAGHIRTVVNEMMTINRAAAKLNKITESADKSNDVVKELTQMMREVVDLHSIVGKLYETLDKDDSVDGETLQGVGANLSTLYMEMKNMVTKKGKRINEADELELGADVAGDEAAAGVDADEVLVQLKLPSSLKDIGPGQEIEVVGVEPAESDDMGDVDELGAEADIDDMGVEMGGDEVPEMEDDLETEGEMMDETEMSESRLNDDDIIEIDEAALVAEMRKMKKLREKKSAGKGPNGTQGGHGAAHFDAFGGGKDEGEPFVDGEDLNANDPIGSDGYLDENASLFEADEDELCEDEGVSGSKKQKERQKKEMGETHQRVASNKQPSEKSLSESLKKARVELAEQKLFNTKLVALNRVLQIPGLTKNQKSSVVETLDSARSVEEVGKLYSKIVETLKSKGKAIHESTQVSRGSSSRPTTSAAPSNDSDSHPLLERWNKIAFGGSEPING
jgi:hypothetical protein